jgi:hydroxymethylbilane synthase
VAGHATLGGGRIRLDALVAAPDGSRIVRAALEDQASAAAALGTRLAEQLLAAGAREILAALGIAA